MRSASWVYLPVVALLPLLVPACGGDEAEEPEAVRPVVVTTLEIMSPQPDFKVTGVAEPYRAAEVSFEVSGRITAIFDVGRNVQIRTREKTAEEIEAEKARRAEGPSEEAPQEIDPLVHVGDVIAQIDDTSYRQRLAASQRKWEVAQAGLAAQRIDLDQVAPATVARARAQRDAALSEVEAANATIASAQSVKDTAERDLERNTALLRDRKISSAEHDQYRNAFDTAAANLAKAQAGRKTATDQAAAYEAALTEAKASLRLKAENVARTQAELREIEVAVDQARTDLERCVLRAPFAGRITRVHASHGDFVSAGKPVLTLTLIDPIKVSVTISADNERSIKPGDYARVRPKSLADYQEEDVLFGTVFEKGAVADPATRTFRIDVMVRNRRRLLPPVAKVPGAAPIGFRDMLPAVERNFGEGGPLFVCATCCVEEQGAHALYRVKGAKFGRPRPAALFEKQIELERIEVELAGHGEADFMQILNWSFRSVKPAGGGPELENGDLLVNFVEISTKDLAGGVVLERFDWAIRPGDLVPVIFDGREAPKGFWVPDAAIRAQNEKRSVFLLEGDRAKEVAVTVRPGRQRLRRIEGAGLKDGARVVLVGVQYLHDGAKVSVIEEVDLQREIEARR